MMRKRDGRHYTAALTRKVVPPPRPRQEPPPQEPPGKVVPGKPQARYVQY